MTLPPKVDDKAIRGLLGGDDVGRVLSDLGDAVAADARLLAPKRTGAGAASIHAELAESRGVTVARVSWAPEFFYLRFHELGTSHQKPTPFLRPALAKRRTL